MSARRTTRVSRQDLDQLGDLTDWKRVDRLTDEEITAAAATDPDTVHPDDPWWQEQLARSGVVVPPGVRRRRVALWLDNDVIAWFRARDRVYHGLINHALRRYMQDERRREPDTAAE